MSELNQTLYGGIRLRCSNEGYWKQVQPGPVRYHNYNANGCRGSEIAQMRDSVSTYIL